MSRLCGFKGTRDRRPCTQEVGDDEDHCRAGHPCRRVAQRKGFLAELFSPASPSYEVDEIQTRRPSPGLFGPPVKVGTEVGATKLIVREYGWTGKHRVQPGTRGIVQAVKVSLTGADVFTVSWECGFATHEVPFGSIRVRDSAPAPKRRFALI